MQDFIEDELDDNLDDLEPIVDNPAELYEHFRVVVDKDRSKYVSTNTCSSDLSTRHATVSRKLRMPDSSWPMESP